MPLADVIRQKYPGAYDSMSDSDLEAAVIAKYPQYAHLTTSKPSPTESLPSSTDTNQPPVESTPEQPGILSKLWHGATTSVIPGVTEPTMQEWTTDPKRSAMRSLGMGLTTPLAIGGELIGGITGLRALQGLKKVAPALGEVGEELSPALKAKWAAAKVAPTIESAASTLTKEAEPVLDEAGKIVAPAQTTLPEIPSRPLDVNAPNRLVTIEDAPTPTKYGVLSDKSLAKWKQRWVNITNENYLKNKGEIPDQPDVVDKLNAALDQAIPARKMQESIYTAERAPKIARAADVTTPGEAGYHEQLAALKGEHTKLGLTPLRTTLEQPDVDELFNTITNAPIGDEFTKIHAKSGLAKLLNGEVPQASELKILGRVFGDNFVNKVNTNLALVDRKQNLISEVVNLPRTIMASTDYSAPLRQGLPLAYRKEFWNALPDMFGAGWSEKFYKATQDVITNHPNFGFSQETGLKLTDLVSLTNREEQFMSNFAESGQFLGKSNPFQKMYANTLGSVVRGSNRAYVAFLNKLRFDTFNSMVDATKTLGNDATKNLPLARNIADFVNTSTGRGSLGQLERYAAPLNNVLFAPRLIASRLKMMNPMYYYRLDPIVRKEALKALFTVAGLGSTVSTLGAMAGGSMETNPTSPDFMKLRIGNTRLDPFGGFQQYVVAASRLMSGQSKSSVTGQTTDLTAGKFGRPTRLDVLAQLGMSKLNPAVSFATDLLRGRDFQGQPISIPNEVATRFIPMVVQDAYDLAKEDPSLLPLELPGIFGVGVQTYGR